MSITYLSEVKDDILIITANGKDEHAEMVIEYGRSVIQLVIESGVRRVLCDERNIEYNLGIIDTFEAARQVAEHAPKVGRIAIVCRPEFMKTGKFWETVAVNRGLHVRMYTDIELARAWLDE